jgi:hypothetical protein
MDQHTEWVLAGRYSAGFEIDLAMATLESAGIPVLVKGRESGIWGPGFAGPTSQGMTLWVPAGFADEAGALLAPGDGDPSFG